MLANVSKCDIIGRTREHSLSTIKSKMVDRLVNSEANCRRIAAVEQCFGGSGQPLQVPHRVLVGEGVLTKMCRKKPKPRQYFLFNDILVYGNIVISKKKYNKQHIIPLESVKLQSVSDDDNLQNGWQIKSPSKSFTVYAATATEKNEWMAHIQKCVGDLQKKQGKVSTVEESPVWVPDAVTTACQHCKKTQFTVINRRHHCRKCGAVVCGTCSNKRWLLPEQSSKPLRVCLSCYDKLSSLSSGAAIPTVAAHDDSSGEDSSEDDEPAAPGIQDQTTFYQG